MKHNNSFNLYKRKASAEEGDTAKAGASTAPAHVLKDGLSFCPGTPSWAVASQKEAAQWLYAPSQH